MVFFYFRADILLSVTETKYYIWQRVAATVSLINVTMAEIWIFPVGPSLSVVNSGAPEIMINDDGKISDA